ncbi:cytochrome BD ubiquinol oxidase subunit I [Carbonactinospora thermoautotrophica]|uniref:Cytochrome BD ubiquinol oxidase subunit I n=1 Tax=Carbonactinospora thermoautotrophica TaxID=1469144 RepID=A0A132N0Z2_9ACTN|nr:cytochrome BD ubiquinol oxidase subunit I [Carbonactinospora thermoautotrophica]KWX10009.1 cytochrome BD ubiquinol oxidase subunit I [Carbonactinospora thermoautotrophica]
MDPLLLARWQYAITTVYHFLFVPITIGMSTLVAVLQTAWLRTGKEHYLRATKFWGKLFLINFAMGVVTGIVQEFQFGMNWSDYSRFVGDIFGAPLAIEGLLAFFLESTFLGLWIFGWDRLPKKVHLACIWLAAIGTLLSAYFILSANSWMQHPVGYRINPEAGRAELTDIAAVLTQNTAVAAFTHTITAAFLTAAAFMIGVCAWHLARRNQVEVFRPSLKLALVVAVLAGIGVGISGDWQAKIMTQQQPMKMAAAEALWESTEHAPFSVFAYGDVNEGRNKVAIEIPSLLSWLATADPGARVEGINDLQQKYQAQYGPGDYRPNIPVAYWSFRLMIGTGMAVALFALVGLWLTRRGRLPANRWVWRIGIASIALPLIANSLGWIFTEMGRQPWTVFGVLQTSASVSPGVSGTEVLTSLVVFTVLYGVLAVIEAALMVRYAKAGAPEIEPAQPEAEGTAGERPLTFAY